MHPSKFITNGVNEDQVQPNGVDIQITQIFEFKPNLATEVDKIMFGQNVKHNLYTVERKPQQLYNPDVTKPQDPWWDLEPGVYCFETNHHVFIPKGYCAFLIQRSSLARNGVTIQSGLYDSGYTGFIGGQLITRFKLQLQYNTRIAQMVAIPSTTTHLYDGQYNLKGV